MKCKKNWKQEISKMEEAVNYSTTLKTNCHKKMGGTCDKMLRMPTGNQKVWELEVIFH